MDQELSQTLSRHLDDRTLWKTSVGEGVFPASSFPLPSPVVSGLLPGSPKTDKVYVPKPHDTPQELGIKWQCDVKYVPKRCKAPSLPENTAFVQYTMIEETSRERYL